MLVSPLMAWAVLTLGVHAQSDSEAEETTSASTTESSPATTRAPSRSVATSTSSRDPQTITIAVGASGHRFTEDEVTAEIGDTIEWIFYPANHSVIRAEYGYPCTPYEYIDIGRQGFYSGPKPVAAITNDPPRYQVKINDTEPIFYYCGAPGSCYQKHMIGVINPNSTFTLEGQQDALEGLTYQILPGEPFPGEDDSRPPGTSGTPSPNDNDSGGASGSNDGSGSGGGGSDLSAGAIAGIVIGGVAVLIIGAALIWFCGRRGGLDKAQRRDTYQAPPPPPPPVSEANFMTTPKSPGSDSRWSAAQWSTQHSSEPYQDQHSPPAMMSNSPATVGSQPAHGYGYGGHGMENPHTSYMSDPRMSQQGSPPPGMVYSPSFNQPPSQAPVELPTPGNPTSAPPSYPNKPI
ncbi:hypothetical protein VD0002_g7338 [Verticillium dahliae]|uniref:Extracellular serine-rich protein n=1 Tax=Verticillium dahliae TaxID=27337 RepID=A0AA44WCP7_VERDA|nr:hypothetical protein EV126DRAFT_508019 [Verticillium dahliae]PNH29214.1 hypothetical protein BJF96_g7499 [Verticillium dahliae]PNH51095.1 hypothetical protein VD0003_g6109 [Verticillium dahliae]PNH60286.1 hypothetical protein VD0002_g7338 [Verticillium dahliae]